MDREKAKEKMVQSIPKLQISLISKQIFLVGWIHKSEIKISRNNLGTTQYDQENYD